MIAAAHAVGVTHGDLHPGDVDHHFPRPGQGARPGDALRPLGERSPRRAAGPRRRSGLGALLYASLTGRWPLGAGRGLPAAETDSNGACRSPRQLRAGVPRELDALAMAALGRRRPRRCRPAASRPSRRAGAAYGRRDGRRAQVIAAELPTGSQPALDDDPEAYTPAGQTAKAAQAERLARDNAARRRTMRRRVLPVVLLVVLALVAWLIGVAVGRLPAIRAAAPPSAATARRPAPTGALLRWRRSSTSIPRRATARRTPARCAVAYDDNLGTAWSTEDYSAASGAGITSPASVSRSTSASPSRSPR